MAKYSFSITVPVTMSANVIVEADTIEEAREIALMKSFYNNQKNATFTLDEDNDLDDAYIPDENDYEIIEAEEDDLPFGMS